MKYIAMLLFLTLSGCTVNRYYYIAEDPIELYESSDFSGKPLLTANVGDTISSTNVDRIQLGGTVPVEYRGYRFYAPYARARFLRITKIRKKRDAAIPAVVYASAQRRSTNTDIATPGNYGYTPTTGAYIHTGPRGGKYYYNSKGNKTYVKRSAGSSPSKSSRTRSSGSSYRSSGTHYRSSGSRGRH